MKSCPPYRPLRGSQPPHFVDRAEAGQIDGQGVLASVVAALANGPADPRTHRLLVGGPALGKTALLRSAAAEARRRLGWAVVFHSCRAKQRALGTVVAEAMASMARQWPQYQALMGEAVLHPRLGGMARGARLAHPAGRGVVAVPGAVEGLAEASWAELRMALHLAGRFASSIGRGLLVVADDIDALIPGEAEAFGWLSRSLAGEGLPVSLLLSCKPPLAEHVARSGNYGATLWVSRLGPMGFDDVAEALAVPAAERGVVFAPEALELAHRSSCGEPLEVQRLGFGAWSTAAGPHLITVEDVASTAGARAGNGMAVAC